MMDFRFTPEHDFWRKTVADMVKKLILPRVKEIDEGDAIPKDLWAGIGRLGYFGLRYPEKYGGMGADTVTAMIFYEELAKGSCGLAMAVIMQCLMGTHFVFRFGTEEMRQRLLVPAMRGEKIGTICFTEEQSGSDLAGTRTKAVKDGDGRDGKEGWILKGTKMWITQAPVCDFATVLATTDPSLGLKGLNFFLVERGMPGFAHGQVIHKLGAHGPVTGELVLDNVRVPKENLLGEAVGKGVFYMSEILSEIRCMTAAVGLGIAQAAFAEGLDYSRKRSAFGSPIGTYQLIRAKIARMATEMEAARLLLYSTASKLDRGENTVLEAAMTKSFATDMCLSVVDEVARIHGAMGFAMEASPQRFLRDARFLLYGGGTQEILADFIGRTIVGKLEGEKKGQ
ncbi:MAG: acyl-CoA dehydrogenase family protein [Planctomycetota bacterium]|nr:acyl-CoA dehydrogenase family protein [Planctomycetota bacterium]